MTKFAVGDVFIYENSTNWGYPESVGSRVEVFSTGEYKPSDIQPHHSVGIRFLEGRHKGKTTWPCFWRLRKEGPQCPIEP